MLQAGVLAAAALLAAPSTPRPTGAVITQPDWQEIPSAEQLAHAYPKTAARFWIEGRASISCLVTKAGGLDNCQVREVTPRDLGFDAAALSMSRYFRLRPMTRNGEAVADGEVRVPIRFSLPEPKPPPPTPAKFASPEVRELALRWIDASGALQGYEARYQRYARALQAYASPEVNVDSRNALAAALQEAAAARRPAFRELLARIAADGLTAPQLRQLLTFQATPDGAAILQFDEEARATQERISREFGRRLKSKTRDEFCRRWDCTPPPVRSEAPVDPSVDIPKPAWVQWANYEAYSAARPRIAQMLGLGGEARLTCTIGENGVLADCRVAQETPEGLGFGAAAMSLRGFYKAHPLLMSEGAYGKTTSVYVPFFSGEIAEEAPPLEIRPRSELSQQLALAVLSTPQDAALRREEAETILAYQRSQPLPGASPEAKEALIVAMAKAAQTANQDVLQLHAAAMTQRLTDGQLRSAAMFWRTPLGQALRASRSRSRILWGQSWNHHDAMTHRDAGERYCRAQGCQADLGPLQPISDKPAASTAKP